MTFIMVSGILTIIIIVIGLIKTRLLKKEVNHSADIRATNETQTLSFQCPHCGASIKFDSAHIATFCSFCGTHLPDLTDYVKNTIALGIEKEKHVMAMETADKEIRREQIKSKAVNLYNIFGIITVVAIAVVLIVMMISFMIK